MMITRHAILACLIASASQSVHFAAAASGDGSGLVGELDSGLDGVAVPADLYCGINDNLKLSIEDCTTSACRHKLSPMMNVTFEGYPTCVEAYSIASDGEVEMSVGAPDDCLTLVLGRIFGSPKAWNSLDISVLRGPTAGTCWTCHIIPFIHPLYHPYSRTST